MSELTERNALEKLSTLLTLDDVDYNIYVGNPKGFINDVLDITMWSRQEEIVQSVIDNRFTVVESGFGIGKSLATAMLTCWWLTTHEEEGVVVTLAPTHQQVASIVWRYIRHMSHKAKLPGTVFETPRWDIAANRYGVGLSPRKASKEDMATLQGYHSKYLLVIMDEAGGLPRLLFDGVVALCVGENNRVAAIGNPIEKSGPFYEASNSKTWHHIRISCFEHPNVIQNKEIIPGAVSRTWVEERIHDHCTPYKDTSFPIEVTNKMSDMELEGICPPGAFVWNRAIYVPDAWFEAKVLGRPPDEASDQLIALSWVEAAKQWDYLSEGERILGLDPARYGGDYATLALRQGKKVHWVKRRKPITSDPTGELAGWLKVEMDRLGFGCWGFIDEIGIGAGVLDAAKRIGLNVRGVSFSKRARQNRRFANVRAELWWRIREALQRHELNLPDDDMLAGDLTAPKFSYDDLGRVLIEDKDDIRKRIGRSPDAGDAVALTFAAPSLDVVNEDGFDQVELTEMGSRWYMATKPDGSRWRTPSSRSRFRRR